MIKQIIFAFLLIVSFVMGQNVNAQSFAEREETAINNNSGAVSSKLLTDKDIEKNITEENLELQRKWVENNVFMPMGGLNVLDKKTADGTDRGHSVVVEINNDGRSRRAEKIFLYAENFRISSLMKNMTVCDVRFVVLANLDKKISQLDVKLLWPDMTTTLSFSNVMPNTPTYMDYTLMGDGCYSMDKMPNIVVNRCRVRGMSAVDCANSIVWLKAIK